MENSFCFHSKPGIRTAPALSLGHKRALCCGGTDSERPRPWPLGFGDPVITHRVLFIAFGVRRRNTAGEP